MTTLSKIQKFEMALQTVNASLDELFISIDNSSSDNPILRICTDETLSFSDHDELYDLPGVNAAMLRFKMDMKDAIENEIAKLKDNSPIMMSDAFKKMVEKIKEEDNLDKIGEIQLFKDERIHEYFPLLLTFSPDSYIAKQFLEIEDLNRFFDYSKYQVEETNKLARIVYSSPSMVAIQLVFK